MALGLVFLSSLTAFLAVAFALLAGHSFGIAVLAFYAVGFTSMGAGVAWIMLRSWTQSRLPQTTAPHAAKPLAYMRF